jgi:hypothetical protein
MNIFRKKTFRVRVMEIFRGKYDTVYSQTFTDEDEARQAYQEQKNEYKAEIEKGEAFVDYSAN